MHFWLCLLFLTTCVPRYQAQHTSLLILITTRQIYFGNRFSSALSPEAVHIPGLANRCDHRTSIGCESQSPHLATGLVNASPGVAGAYFLPLRGDNISKNEVSVEESRGKPWNATDSCLQWSQLLLSEHYSWSQFSVTHNQNIWMTVP